MIPGYILRTALVALIALPAYLLVRRWVRADRPFLGGREILLALFSLFVVALMSQTVLPRSGLAGWAEVLRRGPLSLARERLAQGNSINLVPLHTILLYFPRRGSSLFTLNIWGNILMFVPLGLCPPLLWRLWRPFGRVLLLGAGLSCLIEGVQLFIGRSVDVDDVILNALGALLGYLLYLCLSALFPGVRKMLDGPGEQGQSKEPPAGGSA